MVKELNILITGVGGQGVILMSELQGRAALQVKDAANALTHNLSGGNVEHTIVVYSKEPKK